MGLMRYVKTLALNPPIEIWKSKAPENVIQDSIDAFGYINIWEQAGSICDLVSYIVMRIALGADRMERLEKLQGSNDLADGAGSVRRFTDSNAFSQYMNTWVESDSPGVVQFKFAANDDVHTFAAERYTSDGAKKFQVYQGYQGGYRLSDFLGITDPKAFLLPRIMNEKVHQHYNKPLWRDNATKSMTQHDFEFNKECPEKGTSKDAEKVRKQWAKTQQEVFKELNDQVAAVKQTSNHLREEMGADAFKSDVISPLSSMVQGGATGAAYQRLSGHKASDTVTCGRILVVTGNYDDSKIEANFRSLLSRDNISRGFISLD